MQTVHARHYYSMIPAAILATICIFVTAGCGRQSPPDTDSAFQEPSESIPANVPDQPSLPILNVAPPVCVVEVNGAKLMQNELDQRLRAILAEQRLDALPPQQLQSISARIKDYIVDEFIAKTLLFEDAARQKIEATDEEVSAEIATIRGTLPEDLTLEDLLAQRGVTIDVLREDIKRSLTIAKLIETHVEGLPEPTDEDIEAFYNNQPDAFSTPEKVRARHVLIDVRSDLSEEQMLARKALADECRKKLLDGADFAAVALEYSACGSRKEGGDLGFFPRGRMAPEFEEASFSQPLNEIGPVIQTQFGYHIIEALEREEARMKPLEEAREEIVARLNDEQRRKVLNEYMENLKSAADIKRGTDQKPSSE